MRQRLRWDAGPALKIISRHSMSGNFCQPTLLSVRRSFFVSGGYGSKGSYGTEEYRRSSTKVASSVSTRQTCKRRKRRLRLRLYYTPVPGRARTSRSLDDHFAPQKILYRRNSIPFQSTSGHGNGETDHITAPVMNACARSLCTLQG